jgi:hypothetical protein
LKLNKLNKLELELRYFSENNKRCLVVQVKKKNTTTEPQGPGLWGPWKMRLAPVRNHALAAFG